MTTVISVRGRIPNKLRADPNFIYVGRQCAGWPRSIWGNPFKVADCEPGVSAVELFTDWLNRNEQLKARLPELRGKTLGCWCGFWKPGGPEIGCHAVVLARMVNPVECDLFGPVVR